MKPKSFAFEKGKYVVVATYTNHNDTTGSDDEGTTKTHERPRDNLIRELATLGMLVRGYWDLGNLKLRVAKIAFAENQNDGHLATFFLETVDGAEKAFKAGPFKIKRELELIPGTNDRKPESQKNELLDQIDLVENKIIEYLNGDREQAVLPPVAEQPATKKQRGLFGFGKEKSA